jgi:hypothetical protein
MTFDSSIQVRQSEKSWILEEALAEALGSTDDVTLYSAGWTTLPSSDERMSVRPGASRLKSGTLQPVRTSAERAF